MKSLWYIVVVLCCLVESADAHNLEIKSLACQVTEDYLGTDECELRIYIDGGLKEKLRQDMRRDDVWDIRKTYRFSEAISVELWDLDSPDPDDHLGTLHVAAPRSIITHAQARLSRDGARYDLTYAIAVSQQAASPLGRARLLLRAFSADSKIGAFVTIDKKKLVHDLEERIENPAMISHSSQALCGPAAILYLLATNNPERYVELARALFTDGRYRIPNGKIIKPREHLFTDKVPEALSPADWMMAASLRDAANLIFDFAPDGQFAGITLPAEMGAWMEGLLGCRQIEVNTSFLYGEKEALQAAKDAIESGNPAVLVINSTCLPGRKTDTLRLADHWVVLLSVGPRGKSNIFRIWSWTEEFDLDLSDLEFKHCMWGAVIGYF